MQRIGFVVFDGFQSMSMAALSVFEYANVLKGKRIYDVEMISESGGLVQSSTGMAVDSRPFGRTGYNTVLIGEAPGYWNTRRPGCSTSSARLRSDPVGSPRSAPARSSWPRREFSTEGGPPRTGGTRELQARYPLVQMDEDRIFIIDGPVWTSAGMTAGIDLALAMVEKDLGAEVTRSIARKLVLYHRRAGGQSQHSALLEMAQESDTIQKVLAYARQNLRTALSVEQLAEAAFLSPRQFSRVFRAGTGQSPAKAVENLRLESARWRLEQTGESLDEIAKQTGFTGRRRMREVFLRVYGQPPQVIRRNARADGAVQAG